MSINTFKISAERAPTRERRAPRLARTAIACRAWRLRPARTENFSSRSTCRHCRDGHCSASCYGLQTTGPTTCVLLVRPRTRPASGGPFFATSAPRQCDHRPRAARRALTQAGRGNAALQRQLLQSGPRYAAIGFRRPGATTTPALSSLVRPRSPPARKWRAFSLPPSATQGSPWIRFHNVVAIPLALIACV
jgi:hypothetical protein